MVDAARGARTTEESPSGTVALALGIIGIFTGQPIIPAIALVFGYRSRREAEEQPDRYHDGFGRTGRILGWVGVAIGVIAILAVAIALLA